MQGGSIEKILAGPPFRNNDVINDNITLLLPLYFKNFGLDRPHSTGPTFDHLPVSTSTKTHSGGGNLLYKENLTQFRDTCLDFRVSLAGKIMLCFQIQGCAIGKAQ